MFNSQFAWEYGYVEYALATALRLRGHDVRMVICGGLPDYCELETHNQSRPACANCIQRVTARLEAFDLPFVVMRDSIDDDDIEFGRRTALETEPAQLRGLTDCGVSVGRLAFLNLFQYFRGYPLELTGRTAEIFRRCVCSAILIARATGRLFAEHRPDVVCTTNGKFLQWAPFLQVARLRSIPFVTWEDFNVIPGGVVFASDAVAHEMTLSREWKAALEEPFDADARRTVREHFRLWAEGTNTPWPYRSNDVVESASRIRGLLGLRPDRPLVTLFPSVCWDSTSVAFDGAFESMYEWLHTVVEYARSCGGIDFVIRAHPGEVKVSEFFRSTQPIGEFIRGACDPVPPNVRLVEGNSPISSYALGELSDVVMTYTTTLGLEFALRGIRPWVAARASYAGRGFTLDLRSAGHMTDLLDDRAFDCSLSKEEQERAERFAHLVRFRKVFSFPHLDGKGGFNPPDYAFFAPGGSPVLDDLCESFLNRGQFLDVGKRAVSASGVCP